MNKSLEMLLKMWVDASDDKTAAERSVRLSEESLARAHERLAEATETFQASQTVLDTMHPDWNDPEAQKWIHDYKRDKERQLRDKYY